MSSSEETRRDPVVALVFLPVREWQSWGLLAFCMVETVLGGPGSKEETADASP